MNLKARHGAPGVVRPRVEIDDQIIWNHDRGRPERRRIVVDREHDHYVQEWFDLETGELTWRKEGRLSDPDMHGQSARPRRA